MRHVASFIFLSILAVPAYAQFARTSLPSQHIESPSPGYTWFGKSIAVSGDLLIVGAPLAAVSDSASAGIVYIYRNEPSGWVLTDSVTAHPFVGAKRRFGYTVAIIDSVNYRFLVGSPGHNGNDSPPGTVFEFELIGNSWNLKNTYASGSDKIDNFGFTIAVGSDEVVIGAPVSGPFAGLYVYENIAGSDSLILNQHIAPPPPAIVSFGVEMKLSSSELLVADSAFEQPTSISLFAYAKSDSGWIFVDELDLPESALIGAGFDLHDNFFMVQTLLFPFSSERDEAVYWYGKNQGEWEQRGRIAAIGEGLFFGDKIVISGTLAFIAAPQASIWQASDGAAYVYSFTGQEWTYCCAISSLVPIPGGGFGDSMATDGSHLVIGSHTGSSPSMDIFMLPSVVSKDHSELIESNSASLNVYPNPTKVSATFNISVDRSTNVSLCIHDLLGRKLECPLNNLRVNDHSTSVFNLSSYSSGTYFVRMSGNGSFNGTVEKLVIL